MAMIKHGTGRLLKEDEPQRKEAARDWSDEDQAALDAENDKADQ